jgi:hypothetical protein
LSPDGFGYVLAIVVFGKRGKYSICCWLSSKKNINLYLRYSMYSQPQLEQMTKNLELMYLSEQVLFHYTSMLYYIHRNFID